MFDKSYVEKQFNYCPDIITEQLELNTANVRTIIDFGCGHGVKALAIALKYPDKQVIGVDITRAFEKAAEFSNDQLQAALPKNLSFVQIDPGQSLKTVTSPDAIYSWSVLEHVERTLLPDIIADMHNSLSPDGQVFTQIAPLYYSPFGSHLREFIETPWAHLTLDHSTLKQRVERKHDQLLKQQDKRQRAWMFEQFNELNKITAEELSSYFADAGFEFKRREITKTQLEPPAMLHFAFTKDALLTNELRFITAKSRQPMAGARSGLRTFWSKISNLFT